MDIILQISADLLHITKLLIICKCYLMLEERSNKIKHIIIMLISIVASLSIMASKNINIDFIIYLFSNVLILCIYFNCKFLKILVCGIWTILIIEGVGMMMTLSFDVLKLGISINSEQLVELLVEIITLLIVIIVGKLLKRINKNGLKNVESTYLIIISVITITDLVILNIMFNSTMNEITFNNRILYIISFIFVTIGMYIQIAAVLLLVVSRNVYREKEHIIEQCLDEQIKHYEYMNEKEKNTKKFRHDIREHLYFLNKLKKEGKEEEYGKYLHDIICSVDELVDKVNVGNDIVNAILNKFYSESINKNIKMNVSGHLPYKCNISAYDMCTIFSNLLNNAIEAAEKTREKEIWVICKYNLNEIIIEIGNYHNNINVKKNNLKTSKKNKEYHGWGLDNVKDSVEKNNGLIDFEIEENKFTVSITLNYERETVV